MQRLDRQLRRINHKLRHVFDKRDKMQEERLNLPFSQFVSLMPYMTDDTIKALAILPPQKDAPLDLQQVTFGVLVRLQNAVKADDYLATCCGLVEVLTDTPTEKIERMPAIEVLGIVNMIQGEMERIGKLFQSLNTEHSQDELSAGIDRLNFGTFGIVDWYAKRMGIINHDEVFATPWQRIYQCMKIDHENNEFEKRYRKVIEQRSKRK